MCGIVGFIDYNKQMNLSILKEMSNKIAHRGPDENGHFFKEYDKYGIGLGHKRLSIIDLNKEANQPMQYNNKIIVFNGEVYNYKEIKKELIKIGYSFQTNSDTEVILKAFDKWGTDCIKKFRGMFAFAIFDEKLSKFYLVRDRVGVKPLYFTINNDKILFGSELKSFNFIMDKKINPIAIQNFFEYGYIKAPLTIFENIEKLIPAHFIEYDLKTKKSKLIKYWDLTENIIDNNFIYSEKLIENTLRESINLRLVSDVEVGLFFSGGIDSSLIAALIEKNIKLFYLDFSKGNSFLNAENIAKTLNKDFYPFILNPKDTFDILTELSFIYDEPMADNSVLPTLFLSQFTRKHVKVALSGDGGDELFFGYDRYLYLEKIKKLNKNLSYFLNQKLINLLPNTHLKDKILKIKYILEAKTITEQYDILTKVFFDKNLSNLLNKNLNNSMCNNNLFKFEQNLMNIDIKSYLSDYILTKVDRASMFHSLEAREPLLDHKLIEMAFNMPLEFKYKNGQTKWILKKILEKYLPQDLIYRKKEGFSFPIEFWLKNELKDIYLEYSMQDNEFLNKQEIIKINDLFFKGYKINPLKPWFIFIFQMWYKRWM